MFILSIVKETWEGLILKVKPSGLLMKWIRWRGVGGNRRDVKDDFALRNWMDSAVIYWDD